MAWMELEDAGEELAEAADREGTDSGLQSQELRAEQGQVPTESRGGPSNGAGMGVTHVRHTGAATAQLNYKDTLCEA